MVPITFLVGDATDPQVLGPKIIAHVVNDVGAWGAGFVLALSRRWTRPEDQYRLWWVRRDTTPFELGRIQLVPVEPGPFYAAHTDLWVANMIAQRGIEANEDGPPIRYDAVETCLAKLANQIQLSSSPMAHASVHMPRIGCGLAGGRWDQIEPIIQRTLSAYDVPVYVYDLPDGIIQEAQPS